MASLGEKITYITSEHLGVEIEEITNESKFAEDLGADFLDVFELIMAFEEEFDCEIPDTDAKKMKTLGDAIKYIDTKVSQKPPLWA